MTPAAPSAFAPPDDKPSSVAAAVRVLEEDIVLGRLHPRERLTENDLIARFGLKRHTAREVLAELARLGLVQYKKNIGNEVRSFSAKQVLDLYQLRELLEAEAARRMPCPLSEDALQNLVLIQLEHDAAVAGKDPRAVFRANQRFHETLFGFCRNEALQKAIREYARQTHPIRFSSLVDASYRERARQEHWAMIQALREGRRDTLIDLCRAHLTPSRDTYLKLNSHQREAQ